MTCCETRTKEYCIVDKCSMCETPLTLCSVNGSLEGALIYFVPGRIQRLESPWGLKKHHRHKKYGFNNISHCQNVLFSNGPFDEAKTFLDLVDMAIFDHLLCHFDSKVYISRHQGNYGLFLHIDRGRAFAPNCKNDVVNLLPLWQCCKIRENTWKILSNLRRTSLLAAMLQTFQKIDMYNNSLLDMHQLTEMDVRLDYILTLVQMCVTKNGKEYVFTKRDDLN